MKRGTPLKRTPFRRKEGPTLKPAREWSGEYRPERPRAVMARCDAPARPMPKDAAVRSEAYRRLVAAKPCKHCGRIGRSQAAHPPPEGKSIKHDDRKCFALCCDELMRKGCHPRFDQYELCTHDVALRWAATWAFETRAEILAAGEWPPGLELFDEAAR